MDFYYSVQKFSAYNFLLTLNPKLEETAQKHE
jgi:hypothetical protein